MLLKKPTARDHWYFSSVLCCHGLYEPTIVTPDEIPDPQDLNLGCSVNGKTLQKANTKDMIFSAAALISKLSHSFTLEAGDIIASGTPPGVGFSRNPPVFLKSGDTVTTWINGIGKLNNPVIKK